MTPREPVGEMVDAARAVRLRAHAPYSRYAVGAAVRAADGRIFVGANVENASYGLTLCAERAAVCAAVADGVREIVAVVVVTRDGTATPCGACRQVLWEFRPQAGPPMTVWLTGPDGDIQVETTLDALLPGAFGAERL